MTDENPSSSARFSSVTGTLLLLGVGLLGGCSSFKSQSASSTAQAESLPPESSADVRVAVARKTPPTMSPADIMFNSSEPFSETPGTVSVFGELDGFGPSAFVASGKAGYQQHTFLDEGFDANPTVSPDGKWLLFSSTRHSERADLYLQRVDGLAVTQLTSDPAEDGFARFSRDGRQIVFASTRAGNWDIYVMDVEGNNVRQLTRSPAQEIHPTFSPDGRHVVFSSLGSRSGQWELWTVDVDTLERRMIGFGLFPDWSPRTDRDVIAFQRARQRGTHWFSAWTLDLVDGEAKNVTEIAYSTNAAIVAPTWSPNGKRLAFSTIIDPQAGSTGFQKQFTQDIWTVNADGTDRMRLTDGQGVHASPTWARDGRIYFISDRGGTETIWSMASNKARNDTTARLPTLPDDSLPTASVPSEETH